MRPLCKNGCSEPSVKGRRLCRKCQNSYWRKYYLASKDRYRRVQRSAHLKRNYGITQEDYERMLVEQNHSCAICGSKDPGGPRRWKTPNSFHVDHNHETGKVRKLLCSDCNLLLGRFEAFMPKAIAYLKEHA